MKKIETILEENHRRTLNLEKENKDLEDKLTSVNILFYYLEQ